MSIEQAYDELRQRLDGQSIAELEIEARRDAQQAGFNIRQNPYPAGSFESLCYTSECQIHWHKTTGAK
jgi:serine phosphatase RsbU (regulator of sigma subunit)